MYSWLRDGLIPGVDALLEALWFYAWFNFFLATGDATSTMRYPFYWLLGLMLVPALIGRFLDRTMRGPQWLRQYGLTATVIGMFGGFMLLYRDVGVAWLAAVVLLARGIWLALIRQQEIEEHAFRRAENNLNGTWLALLAGISGGIVALVAIVSFGGSGVLLGVLHIAGAIAALIWQVAGFIAATVLGPALLWLFGLIHFGAGESAASRLLGRRQLKDVDPIILAWLQKHIPLPVLLALVLGLIMALLGVWLAARYRAWSHEEDEERSSVWSWRLFWSQIRQALRGMRGALRGHSGMSTAPRPEPEPVVSSIRQLYAAVLRWCGERRRPRAPADTPLEYEPALDEELGNELGRDLTDAYVLARYAEEDADPEAVRSLRERWEARLSQPA